MAEGGRVYCFCAQLPLARLVVFFVTVVSVLGFLSRSHYSLHIVSVDDLPLEKRNSLALRNSSQVINIGDEPATTTFKASLAAIETIDTNIDASPRLCRLASEPSVGETIHKSAHGNMKILYQCAGIGYQRCADDVARLAKNSTHPTWGKQGEPLVRPGTTILFIGCSHTRQVLTALACQYSEDLIEIGGRERYTSIYRFKNNITLMASINSAAHYTLDWKNIVEDQLGRKIDSFDAVVMGQFNNLYKSKSSKYYGVTMQEAADLNITLSEDVDPPKLANLASVYQGPIIGLSNFDEQAEASVAEMNTLIDQLKNDTGRDNVVALDAVKYITEVPGCAHEGSGMIVSIARNYKRLSKLHRCIGGHGGHPDLLAWDIVEALKIIPSHRASKQVTRSGVTSATVFKESLGAIEPIDIDAP